MTGAVQEEGRSDGAAHLTYGLPAVRVISWQQSVGLLDTGAGAIYRIAGSLDNPGGRLLWELRVPPVTGPTSGLLELQRPTFSEPDETFLVDAVTGRTWLLRLRPGGTGRWQEIEMR